MPLDRQDEDEEAAAAAEEEAAEKEAAGAEKEVEGRYTVDGVTYLDCKVRSAEGFHARSRLTLIDSW